MALPYKPKLESCQLCLKFPCCVGSQVFFRNHQFSAAGLPPYHHSGRGLGRTIGMEPKKIDGTAFLYFVLFSGYVYYSWTSEKNSVFLEEMG